MADELGDHRWFSAEASIPKGNEWAHETILVRKSAVIGIRPAQHLQDHVALYLESKEALVIKGTVREIFEKHFKESFKDLQADTEPLLDDIA